MALERAQVFGRSLPLVWTFRPDGDIDSVNDAWSDYTGISREAAIGSDWHAAFERDRLRAVLTEWQQVRKDGGSIAGEVQLRRSDGAYLWFLLQISPTTDDAGRVLKWCCSAANVDRHRRSRASDNAATSDGQASSRTKEQTMASPVRHRSTDGNFVDDASYSRLILDSIPGMICVFTAEGAVEFVSRRNLDFFGSTEEDQKRWASNGSVHPDDIDRAKSVFGHAIATGEPFELDVRARRADGQYVWLRSRGVPLKAPDGRVLRWYNLLVDIDAQKRAEAVMRDTEIQLRKIIDTIPAMAWSARTDGTAEFFNQRYLDYVGQSFEALQDWGWTAAIHPEDLSRLGSVWENILATGTAGECEARMRRFDGGFRWFLFRVNPLSDSDGKILKWYGTNTDIDDLKRLQNDLRRSEAFLAEGQHLAKIGNFSWHVASQTIVWSEPLCSIYEIAPETPITLELIGGRFHPEDLPLMGDMSERAARGEQDFEYHYRIFMADGSIKYLHIVGHRMSPPGLPVEYMGAVLDVTQQRHQEEALEKIRSELAQVTRFMSLGVMTASIAHEVNQPLAGIVTNASTCLRMLAADPPDIELAKETARRTIRDGNRAADVISKLRSLFSGRAETIEAIDLNEATLEVIGLFRSDFRKCNVTLQTDLAVGLPRVVGDRVQLQQVITNLLRNAIDALSEVDGRERGLSITTDTVEGGDVRLAVCDTGVGFEADAGQRIFDAFYTTKANGMGIGLSVSRSILERHDGMMRAHRNEGPGVTVSFTIPQWTGS